MRVIVYAEDLSGRNDDGYYSKPDLASALEIFFGTSEFGMFLDRDGEQRLSRNEAEGIFDADRRVTFFNDEGEKVTISVDPTE
ncbi:hypothetical protein [Novosphingobium sp.]|uniref:hypothetical protein n=1 Tax=Novosphingobium sp. TaxID=1874826 RepID=UPI003B51B293